MKNYTLLVITLLIFITSTKSQVYVDQITGNVDLGGRPAQYFPDFGYCTIETADDFTVPNGSVWNIDSVFTYGTFSTVIGSSFDTVIVTFFNDNSGVPGNSFHSDTVVLDSSNTDNFLEVPLNNTVQLTAGTYWLTVDAVMPFNNGLPPGGQWFQGAFGSTPIGNEWYIRDPCDLFGTGIISWHSATSQGATVFDLMFMLKSGPCAVVSDTSLQISDATLTSNQSNATYQWMDCNTNSIIDGATLQSYTATINGSYACIITNGCAIDTSTCQQINCLNNINNGIAVSNNDLHAMDTAASFQWIDCNGNTPISGATSQVYTVTQTGSYACALTSGCATDTTNCIHVIINGINNSAKNIKLQLYPNPVTQFLHLEANQLQIENIKIFTLTGEQMVQIPSNAKIIDLSHFSSGIYVIQIETANRTFYRKIVKE